MRVAVVAHTGKKLGGAGVAELRAALEGAGVQAPLWYEIGKSSKAGGKVRRCLKRGARLLIVWGGDGTVRACIDALVDAGAGRKVVLAIAPAGTANLLARNLGIPVDLAGAVEVALGGKHRRVDVGRVKGEHFAVMAGAGFDAAMIRDANAALKKTIGTAAYFWSGIKNLGTRSTRARVSVDGARWFSGDASCVLVGNVGELLGGVSAFPEADPDDGLLDVGVVQADSPWEWLKVMARTATGDPAGSPLVSTARGKKIDIRLGRRRPYQLDGGDRARARRFKVRLLRRAITVCVP